MRPLMLALLAVLTVPTRAAWLGARMPAARRNPARSCSIQARAQHNETGVRAGARGGLTRRAAVLAAGGGLLAGGDPAAVMADDVATTALDNFRFSESDPVWRRESDVTRQDKQRTYNKKFVAYFARLLLNFDRASQSWWQDQTNRPFVAAKSLEDSPELQQKQAEDFQKLQASINLGLRAFQSPEGVQRLFALLKARYGGTEAGDRQLALLFSLMGEGQPTSDIAKLVAATDNARVREVAVEQMGSGYNASQPPLVSITAGAASGDAGIAKAVLGPTGRVRRLVVVDGGQGYLFPPPVTVAPPSRGGRPASAYAVLRNGAVDVVVITDAGEGYTSAEEDNLRVEVAPPERGRTAVDDPAYTAPPGSLQARRFQGNSAPGRSLGNPRYLTRAEMAASQGVEEPATPGGLAPLRGAKLRAELDYGVAKIEVVSRGQGYGLDLPVYVVIAPPPGLLRSRATRGTAADGGGGGLTATDAANLTKVMAKAGALLESPLEKRRLTSWLPALSRTFAFTDLLPSTLVPQLDACLGRFTVSPVIKQEKDWCIYFEDEWAVVKGSKLTTYFNPLDGSVANNPIERERELPPSVFLRFALGGALCNAVAEGGMLPIYASKVLAQADPVRYPEGTEGIKRLVDEAGPKALFRALDTTIVGYSLYGALSFGGTELLERLLREQLGPSIAAQYPVQILLAASSIASILAGTAYSPFEALRIRLISAGRDPGVIAELKALAESEGGVKQLFKATLPLTVLEIPYAAVRFVVFDAVSRFATQALPNLDEAGALAVSLFAGALSGAAASLVTQPLDTVVVRVCEGSEGGDADDAGSSGARADAAPSLVGAGAVGGAGAVATGMVSAATTADGAQAAGGTGEASAAAAADEALSAAEKAAAEAAAEAAPLCVLPDEEAGALGFVGAFFTILEEEGAGALFAGATTRALYIAVLSSVQFFLYEGLKLLFGVSPGDLLLFFDVLSGLELPDPS